MNFDFDEWIRRFGKDDLTIKIGRMQEKYHNEPVVDVMKELSQTSIEIIRKLGIEVEDKIYTEGEFDDLEGKVFEYYIYEEMTEEDKSYVKSLKGTCVTNEDVDKVIREMYEISKKHNF